MSLLLGLALGHAEIARWKFELNVFGLFSRHEGDYLSPSGDLLPQINWDFQSHPPEFAWNGPKEAGQRILKQCTDFLTTCADPNQETPPSDAATFERLYRQYYRRILMQVRGWMTGVGSPAPLYLMEWNTLTSHSIVEAGEFHAALICGCTDESSRGGFRIWRSVERQSPNAGPRRSAFLPSEPISLPPDQALFSVLRA